jgi:hypothetical protein
MELLAGEPVVYIFGPTVLDIKAPAAELAGLKATVAAVLPQVVQTRMGLSPSPLGGEGLGVRGGIRNDKSQNGTIRVTYLIDNLSRAGTETQLLALIRSLDRTAVEPSLVILNGENDLSRSLEPTNCPVLRLGVKKLLGLRAVRAALRLRRFWQEHKPHVAQIYFLDSAYFGVPVARLAGVRRVVVSAAAAVVVVGGCAG